MLAQQTSPEPRPLTDFGPYELESTLGRGAMGIVYLARDRRIGRRVAIKAVADNVEFESDDEAVEFYDRLQREAELCGSLSHPNIVTLYDAGYEGDRISYLAMEYVEGESLQSLLKKTPALPLRQAMSIARQMLEGLTFAHEHGITHRDIKPANILINRSGQAKIADFGIARPKSSNITKVGTLLGTPNYMSPEQVSGKPVGPESDLFSTGVVLYEMVAGSRPFFGADLNSLLYNIANEPAPVMTLFNVETPLWCESFVARLMKKNPSERFASAAAALEELEKLQNLFLSTGERSRPESLDTAPTLSLRQGRRQLLVRSIPSAIAWTVLAAVLAGVVIAAMMIVREIQKPAISRLTPAERAEFEKKEARLEEAREAFERGDFGRSRVAYETFLRDYPESTAAKEGLERARLAGENRVVTGREKVARRSSPRKSEAEAEAEAEEKKKPSLWERIRRRFR